MLAAAILSVILAVYVLGMIYILLDFAQPKPRHNVGMWFMIPMIGGFEILVGSVLWTLAGFTAAISTTFLGGGMIGVSLARWWVKRKFDTVP